MDTLTRLLAVWGAVIATTALLWNILRDMRTDRPRLKLSAQIMKLIPDPNNRDYLAVHVVNVGRRPVQVQTFGLLTKGNEMDMWVKQSKLPVTIGEGEADTLMADAAQLAPHSRSIRRICVWDTSGRRWKVGWRNTRKVCRQLSKLAGGSP